MRVRTTSPRSKDTSGRLAGLNNAKIIRNHSFLFSQVEELPGWANAFFASISSTDLMQTMNAGNFFGIDVFIAHSLACMVTKIERTDIVEMRHILSTEEDFTGELGEQISKEEAYAGLLRLRPDRKRNSNYGFADDSQGTSQRLAFGNSRK